MVKVTVWVTKRASRREVFNNLQDALASFGTGTTWREATGTESGRISVFIGTPVQFLGSVAPQTVEVS